MFTFRTARSLVPLILLSLALASSSADEGVARTERVLHRAYAYIVKDSYPPFDEARCGPRLRSAIRAAVQDGDEYGDYAVNLRVKNCFDRYFRFSAYSWERWQKLSRLPSLPHVKRTIYPRMFAADVLYVQITQFWETTGGEFPLRLYAFSPKGLVLDLRGNPGGDVHQAIEILQQFAPRAGHAMLTWYDRSGRRVLRTNRRGWLAGPPVAILVDGETASSAEIVAGVLRLWYPMRVVLIGTKTYGKMSIQTARGFEGFYLRFTSGEIRLGGFPRDRRIHGIGLEPDIAVRKSDVPPISSRDDPYMKAALRWLSERRRKK